MAHAIITTDAIIMNLFPDGEESVIAECFTRDLGRVYIHIQGVKKIVNKHRNHIFRYAWCIIDCVAGKQYYRCTGVSQRQSVYQALIKISPFRTRCIQQSYGLVQRLVPSGIPLPDVFSAFCTYVQYVLSAGLDSDMEIMTLVVQLRILGILGYWNSDWTDEVLQNSSKTFEYVAHNKKSVISLIKKILDETQMMRSVGAIS